MFAELLSGVTPTSAAILGMLVTSLVAVLSQGIARSRFPISYRVAVIGRPQAGKTTLITAMFGHMFRSKMQGFDPRGKSTIERVNGDLANLELGIAPAPTTDQERFGYRVDYRPSTNVPFRRLYSRTYKVEVGDFPGEYSSGLVEGPRDWLHNTEYFKWAVDADAFLFVVDAAQAFGLDSEEYCATIGRLVRASWQLLQEHHLEGRGNLENKRVVLAFTKCDAVHEYLAIGHPDWISHREKTLGGELPPRERVDISEVEEVERHVMHRFQEVVAFLAPRSRKLDTVCTSVVLRVGPEGPMAEYQARMGVESVLRGVLPAF